jgi:hypothetical protein
MATLNDGLNSVTLGSRHVEVFGLQSRASEAINVVHPLSKSQIKAVSKYFHVSVDIFQ